MLKLQPFLLVSVVFRILYPRVLKTIENRIEREQVISEALQYELADLIACIYGQISRKQIALVK